MSRAEASELEDTAKPKTWCSRPAPPRIAAPPDRASSGRTRRPGRATERTCRPHARRLADFLARFIAAVWRKLRNLTSRAGVRVPHVKNQGDARFGRVVVPGLVVEAWSSKTMALSRAILTISSPPLFDSPRPGTARQVAP